MPLLRRKTVPFEPIPVQDSENKIKDVWQVRFTGEIFTNYKKYIEKVMLYKKPVWTCELTGKMNLTYEEALESEKNCREKTKNAYPEAWIPITLEMTQYKQGKLNDVVDKIYEYLKDNYIVGEIIYFKVPNTQQQKQGKIVSINDNSEDDKKYRVHLVSKFGEEVKAGELGNKPVEYDVDFDSLRRDRCIYSKVLIRNFLRESTVRDVWIGAPIVVKHSLAKKYGISEEPPEELKDLIKEKSKKRKRSSIVNNSSDDDEESNGGDNSEETDDDKKNKKSKKEDSDDNSTEKSKKKRVRKKQDKEEDEEEKRRRKEEEEEEERRRRIEELNIKFPIEDLELPKYIKIDDSLAVPKALNDFGCISQKQVSSALMVWDFLNLYGKPLNLFPFTFDFFEKALSYTDEKPINFLIKEMFCSLLVLILDNYKTLNNNNYENFDRNKVNTTTYSVDSKYSGIAMSYIKKLIIHEKKNSNNMDVDESAVDIKAEEDKTIKNENNNETKSDNEDDDNIEINPEEAFQTQTNDPFIWEIFPNHYQKILSIFEKYPVEFGPWYKWKVSKIEKKRNGRNYNLNIESIYELDERLDGWEVVLLSCLIEYGCPSKIPEFETIIAKLCCIDNNQHNNIPLKDIIKSGFLKLTPDEKIIILKFLIDELAVNCAAIRDFIDHSFEVLTELRKQKIELSREKKEIMRLKHEFNQAQKPEESTDPNGNNTENNNEQSQSQSQSQSQPEKPDDSASVISSKVSYESDNLSNNGGNTSDVNDYDSPASYNPSRATLRQKMMMQKKLEREEKERKRREEYNHYREEALDHIRQNRKRNAEKRKIEERERNLERKQQAIDTRWKGWSAMIRLKMLGRDRYYNRYWWYDSSWLGSNNSSYDRSSTKGIGANSSNVIPTWGTGKLFVENVHFDEKNKMVELDDEKYASENSEWSYYSTPAELDVLLDWLNPKGIRESQLLKNIMKVLNDMAGMMVKREQDLTNMLIKNENLENKRTTRSGTNNYQNLIASCYLGYYNRWMDN